MHRHKHILKPFIYFTRLLTLCHSRFVLFVLNLIGDFYSLLRSGIIFQTHSWKVIKYNLITRQSNDEVQETQRNRSENVLTLRLHP